METARDSIGVRANRLHNQILAKDSKNGGALSKEGLLDAFQALYEECNNDYLKKQDKNIQFFVDKYKKSVSELGRLRVNVRDFEIKGVIGRGHFGEVHLVKEKQTGDLYALKTIKKVENIVQKNIAFEEERNIMARTRSVWLTSLKYAFQDECSLFFVMEYHPGGDLLGLLQRQGGTIPESAATFYLGELLLALKDLHEMGYVHRDLKPDNVLLDRCGHVKLADFGSAARLNEKGLVSGGFPVGTPDYVAPEVLGSLDSKQKTCDGYGTCCDYWSLGVLAYELTIGNPPFTAQSTAGLFSKITNHEKHLKFPPDLVISQGYISLIKHLITDKKHRYGYTQIIQHCVFKNLDLNTLRDQIPPYIPRITADDDLSNFSDVRPKKTEPNLENFKRKTHFSGRNLPFVGFTFVRDNNEDYSSSYTRNVKIKDETLQDLKNEVKSLSKQVLKKDGIIAEKVDLEKKLEEKTLKLESVEHLRDKLERDLSKTMSECLALKRTLELERRDRSEVESKALDLIKSAKQKWEIAEKAHLETILSELQEQKEQNAQLTLLNDQLKSAIQLESKHKITAENIEKLSRRSVIGLESRLEKVTAETQNQLVELQACLTRVQHEKQVFAKELDVYKQKLVQKKDGYKKLEGLLNETKLEVEQLKTEKQRDEAVIAKYRKDIDDLKCLLIDNKKVDELEKELENKTREVQTIKKERQQLNEQNEQQLKKINDLNQQRDLLEKQLEESVLNEENTKFKLKALEEVLERLQNGIANLESNGSRETVLKEQVERLEQQLIELHENSALLKQELSQLKTKHWRMQKELENAEIDKRILQRESKDFEKQVKMLNEEIENLKKENEEKNNEIAGLLLQIDGLKKRVNVLEADCASVVSLRNDVQEKQQKIEMLLMDLAQLTNESNNLEEKYVGMQNKNSNLQSALDNLKREKIEQTNQLQNMQQQLQTTRLNMNALRDACVVLENQLVEYEHVLDSMSTKETAANVEREKLLDSLAKTQEEVREAKRAINEEKSLRLLAETKSKRMTDDLQSVLNEKGEVQERYDLLKSNVKDLNEELNNMQSKLCDLEVTVNVKERIVADLEGEIKYLKESNSGKLTLLQNLRTTNHELKRKLDECEEVNKQLVEQTTELEQTLDEKNSYYKEREMKTEATMQQQIKLINYLQTRIEELSSKKKSFAEKLFSHSKKENVPPMNVRKELEVQLTSERQKVRALREEIEALKKRTEPIEDDVVTMEGWIRVVGKTQQKKYTKITETTLYLYNKPKQTVPVGGFVFKRPECHCKFVMEPLASEIDAKLSNDDLSLAVKLEVTPFSQCWPPETFVFLLPDKNEKERCCGVFTKLFQDSPFMQIHGDLVCKPPDGLKINCLVDLNEETRLIGTETGLYNMYFVHINGPEQIHQIACLKTTNTVLMIASDKRHLLHCDLNHVVNLAKCAPCSKPTLTCEKVNLKNLNGFHLLEVSKHNGKFCVATAKQLIIAEYALETQEFVPLRILDTAEPTHCALFTTNDMLIVGADQFFEIDLETFTAEHFLDLQEVNNLYKMKSFPVGVVAVRKQPLEYLCCFNEFAVFVDDCGRCLNEQRKMMQWKYRPMFMHFAASYLYVIQLDGLEMFNLKNPTDDDYDSSRLRIVLAQPRFIGCNEKGVYLLTKTQDGEDEVRFFDAKKLNNDDTLNDESIEANDVSDRFSFTSSLVQCLDNCSEASSESSYPTRKVTYTDL